MSVVLAEAAEPARPLTGLWGASLALAWREVARFLRQPSRLAGTVGQPLVFWLALGTGLSPSFQAAGQQGVSYTEYFYPGMLMMMVLFAGVFSTITVIEDRDQGFLQGVLAAPVSRLSIVLGKVGGAGAIALMQTCLLLLAAPLVGFPAGPVSYLMILLTLMVLSLGCTGLGFLVAWGMSSTSGYHAVMMLVMMPLWFLSGALFPMEGVPAVLEGLMWVNPFTHGMIILRAPFYHEPLQVLTDPLYWRSAAVVLVTVTLVLAGAARRVGRRDRGV
ncbi:ABC transporter permease [Pararhodospirillum photometricum]|uniref:Transport permease protein n=1 Tax=Pararhodospirillum photometricum DSM 122 TaxID=1150469 RepID=H6SKG8_PARPM|nr:ABC transporter permease [Pararhodospirillum photometricum]CCG08483.1 ABC-2 transporter component [Pararhodospirillum photometricum DSM 122]